MKTAVDRFWEKVQIAGPDECWLWIASGTKLGYGSFRWKGATTTAQRVAYNLCTGPIPAGLVVDHLCNVRRCVNPRHLRAVTNLENIHALHSQSSARLLHEQVNCKHGHQFTEENTWMEVVTYKNGSTRTYRHCRTCNRIGHHVRYWNNKVHPEEAERE